MNAPKQATVTVTVDNHKHAGKPVAKGTALTVDEATADWMVRKQIAVPTQAADAAPKKETK